MVVGVAAGAMKVEVEMVAMEATEATEVAAEAATMAVVQSAAERMAVAVAVAIVEVGMEGERMAAEREVTEEAG